jgi:hypothetical protein
MNMERRIAIAHARNPSRMFTVTLARTAAGPDGALTCLPRNWSPVTAGYSPMAARPAISAVRGGFWTVRRSSAERADVVDLAPAGVTAVSLRRLAGWLPHRLSPPFGGKRILRTGGGTSSGSREPRSRRPASRSVSGCQAAPFTVCPRALGRGRRRRVYPPSWSAAAAAGRRWERTARSTLSATIPIVNHQL